MKRSNRAVLAVSLFAALAGASCGSNDPARVDRPPVVDSYSPGERTINAFVGDTLRFQIHASDPDHDQLATSFAVDHHFVFDGTDWNYVIEDTGAVSVRGEVSDGEHTSYIDWRLTREIPVNFPPVIETSLPVEPNPVLVIGNSMNFAVIASDPERLALQYSFSVNDSVVLNERQLRYQAKSVGTKHIRVVVSDGANTVAHEWQLKVTTVPDNIPPAMIPITLAETGQEPGEVNIEWTAVGRDGMVGLPSLYQVRTAPVPIVTEADWARGSDRPNVPVPVPPGTTMRMVAGGLLPARPTYIAVRATDDFGNISPLAPPIQAVTRGMRFGGRVIDTVTWQGIPGARVSFGPESVQTAADGTYEFIEQGYADGTIIARDEVGPEVGNYFDYSKPYSVKHLDVANLYLIPNYQLTTTFYTDFLQFFRTMTDVSGTPYAADQRRRDLPLALYVRDFQKGGLDYGKAVREVADEFDAILGQRVFSVATDPLPAERVETTYNGIIERDQHEVLEWSADWYPVLSLIEFRTVYNSTNADAFKLTARHEFGHALGLNHSLDTHHLMVGGPAPSVSAFSTDEIAVMRTFYAIPRGWNVRYYERN
jgi:Matrixin